jgi:sulfite oxidase
MTNKEILNSIFNLVLFQYHFVRNHGGIPIIDNAAFKLTSGGLVNEPKTLTLADLQDPQKFEPTELTVTLQVNHFKNFSNVIY